MRGQGSCGSKLFFHILLWEVYINIYTQLLISLSFFPPLSLCAYTVILRVKIKNNFFYGVDEGEMQGVHSECLN